MPRLPDSIDIPEPTLTEDRLLGGRITLFQPIAGYRAAIDPVLLAAAVPAGPDDRVLELGIGGGAAALCLAARVPGCRIIGIDRDRPLVQLAGRNILRNGFQGRVEAVVGDVAAAPPPRLTPGFYHHVMANPPYLAADRSDPSPSAAKAAAAVEQGVVLSDWIDRSLAMVRPKGSITFIHRADRVDDLLLLLRGRAGGIIVFPLWPRQGRAAKRVIVQARKDIAAPLTLAAGLVLHGDGEGYTPAAEAVLRDAEALSLGA